MKERIEKLRSRAFAVPFVVGIALLCVLGLAIAPMFSATPKNVPLAIVNLDEGATLPTGKELNAGDVFADKLSDAVEAIAEEEDGEAPIAWVELEDELALDQALSDGEVYGAIVVPEDFTTKQVSSQMPTAQSSGQAPAAQAGAQALAAQENSQAAGQQAQAQQTVEKPSVKVVLNLAESPMLAQTMQASLTSMLSQAGIQADVETVGEAPEQSSSPLAAMMSVQFMVMPLFIMTLIMGIICSVLLWPRGASSKERGRAALMQVGYCVLGSIVAAVCAYGIVAWIGGVSVDASAILLLWLASFCLMLVAVGLCDIALPLGVLVMLGIFALGMSTAVLPAPMLSDFWVDWVLPWAPQAVIGEGLRNIIYLGAGPFEVGVTSLLIWGCVGTVALACACFLPSINRRKAE